MTSCTTARPDTGAEPSNPLATAGRDQQIRRLRNAVTSPSGPSVSLLRGAVGSGRTTVLAALERRLRATRKPVYAVRCLPGEKLTPKLLAHRLFLAITAPSSASPPTARPTGHGDDPGPPGSALRLERVLRARGPAVLLVDDAQHADPDTLARLRTVLPSLPAVRLVLAVPSVGPAPPPEARPSDLVVDLPPLTRDALAALLTGLLRALPDDALVNEVHRLSGGNPAAAMAVIEPSGPAMFRVRAGRARLVADRQPPVPPGADRFTWALRDLGEPVWRTARALSLLEPLPLPAPELIAKATGLSHGTVDEALRCMAGYGMASGPDHVTRVGWRFTVPLVAAAVRARVGPYERRVLSAVAVRACWAARHPMSGADKDDTAQLAWLADRLVDAGDAVGRERAARELAAIAERLRDTHSRQAARWLAAAREAGDDEAATADAALVRTAGVPRERQPHSDDRPWAQLLTLPAGQDTATRRRLLAMEAARRSAEGDPAERYEASATAAHERSREPAALTALMPDHGPGSPCSNDEQPTEPPEPTSADLSHAETQLLAGDPTSLYETLWAHAEGPDLRAATASFCTCLLVAEDARTVTALLAKHGATVEQLPPESTVVHRFLTGDWREAMAAANSLMSGGRPAVHGPIRTLVHAKTSTALLAQGWPSRAATALDVADAAHPPTAYLLAAQRAEVEQFLGRADTARETLRRGLAEAARSGHVLGTAPLRAALALSEAERGHGDLMASHLLELRRIAHQGRDCDWLTYLRTQIACLAVLSGSRSRPPERVPDMRAAIALARSLGQPFELARTLLAVARTEHAIGHRHDPPSGDASAKHLLEEAYDLFGDLGALLWRHRTRAALREAGIRVPGRSAVAEETEVLLTRLVSEGLPNRLLAQVLAVSESSVSTRLNRLYRRLGVRSRVELATAVVTGHPGLATLP